MNRSNTRISNQETETVNIPSKRARVDGGRANTTYPRQRAITACHVCRVRKIKCSNERPACASCISFACACVYDDKQNDHSSYVAAY